MMKRIVSFALVLCLISCMLQAGAAGEPVTFQSNGTVMPKTISTEEEAFRKWASDLVRVYRENYCYLDSTTNEMINRPVRVIIPKKNMGKYTASEKQAEKEAALFMPYYWIAEQKRLFDASVYAERVNFFGVITDEVPYRDWDMRTDPSKRQEIYTWLLTEALKKKIEADPKMFMETSYIDPSVKGYFVYDLSTDTKKYDQSIDFVHQQSNADLAANFADTVIDGLTVAFDGMMLWKKFERAGGDLSGILTEKISTEPDYEKVLNEFMDDLMETLMDTLFEVAEEAVEKARENVKKGLSNNLREALSVQLANAYLNGNRNVIGYLRATYIDNPTGMIELFSSEREIDFGTYDPRTEFKQAVNKLIEKLDDVEAQELAERQAKAEIQDYFTEEVIGMEKILTTQMIVSVLIVYALQSMVSGLTEDLSSFISAMLKEKMKTYKGRWTVLAENLEQYVVDDLVGEATGRIIKAMEAHYREYEPVELSIGEKESFKRELSGRKNDLKRRINAISWDDFPEYALWKFLGRILDACNDMIQYKDQDTKDQNAMKKLEKGDFNEDSSFTGNMIPVVGGLAVTVLRSYIEPFKAGLKEKLYFLNAGEKSILEEDLNALFKKANNLAIKMDLKAIEDLAIELIKFLTFLSGTDQAYPEQDVTGITLSELKTATEYSLGRLPENSLEVQRYKNAKVDGEILNGILGNGELLSTVINTLLGFGDAAENERTEILARDYVNKGKDVSKALAANTEKLKENNLFNEQSNQYLLETGIEVIGEIFSAVWNDSVDFAGNVMKMQYSIGSSLTGEYEVSMMAQRLNATQQISSAIQQPLSMYTLGGIRTNLYNKKNLNVLRAVDDRSDEVTFDYKSMNYQEILDPDLTPNLLSIKALTDDILTQINLDAAGMALYYTFVDNWEEYADTDFYQYFLTPNEVLLNKEQAFGRMNDVVVMQKTFEQKYDQQWNKLF